MAIIHLPGAGAGAHESGRHRRALIVTAVAFAVAAIVVPFGLHGIQRSGATAVPATPVRAAPTTTPHHDTTSGGTLGSRDGLPALLPARSVELADGMSVRVGDITEGTLRRTPASGWQVVVRWDGRPQQLPTTGPVSLRDGSSWVARSGLLYTRVATQAASRFHVYAWEPEGGSAYIAPSLVATDLGVVCFDRAFSDFGDCAKAG